MIRKILTTYAARLDEYLARSHRQPEGVAEVGLIGSAGEQCPNKLVVSLLIWNGKPAATAAVYEGCLGSRSAIHWKRDNKRIKKQKFPFRAGASVPGNIIQNRSPLP